MRETAARVGREFHTGNAVVIPARSKVAFTASPNFMEAVVEARKAQ